jgi:CBS domain-containing protein
MQAKDWMSREPRAVRMQERLDAAARVMWEQDCGICPVVDAQGVLVGVVTDRDACMASYTQGKPLAEIPVATAMARVLRTCRADEPVLNVLQSMQQGQVHRLPVVDARGALVGIVSTTDLVRAAVARPAAVDAGAVVKTLAAIAAPRSHAAKVPVAASAPTAAAPAPAAPAVAAAAAAAAPVVAAAAKVVEPPAKKPVAAAPAASVAPPAKKPAAKGKAKGKKA